MDPTQLVANNMERKANETENWLKRVEPLRVNSLLGTFPRRSMWTTKGTRGEAQSERNRKRTLRKTEHFSLGVKGRD